MQRVGFLDGYRHGPKSFVDEHTLVFDFVSNNPYTRQYDLDILDEIKGDQIAALTIGIEQEGATNLREERLVFQYLQSLYQHLIWLCLL